MKPIERIPKKARIALGYLILLPLLLSWLTADRIERLAWSARDMADNAGRWLGDVVADILRLEAE